MDEGFSFSLDGADALKKEMETLIRENPDALNSASNSVGNKWKKDCNAKMPSKYSYSFMKAWKQDKEYSDTGIMTSNTISNKKPHWHLIENGHEKVTKSGKHVGFVPGKHYAEITNHEFETEYPEIMQEAVEKALKKSGLI